MGVNPKCPSNLLPGRAEAARCAKTAENNEVGRGVGPNGVPVRNELAADKVKRGSIGARVLDAVLGGAQEPARDALLDIALVLLAVQPFWDNAENDGFDDDRAWGRLSCPRHRSGSGRWPYHS